MPPKSLPPAAKQALILNHLRGTRTCHTLKDLEKALPSIASINGMVVKDYITALVDEGKLRTEKIGTGNWYWTFGSEEKKEKEKILYTLQAENKKLEKSVTDIQTRIREAKENREDDGGEREELMMKQKELEMEVNKMKREEESFIAAGVGGIEKKKEDVARWRKEAEMWTDNLYVIEGELLKVMGGDREGLNELRGTVYGAVQGEWSEEGLRELE